MTARMQRAAKKGAPGCKEWVGAPSEGPGRTAQWGKQPAEHSQEQDCADELHLSLLKTHGLTETLKYADAQLQDKSTDNYFHNTTQLVSVSKAAEPQWPPWFRGHLDALTTCNSWIVWTRDQSSDPPSLQFNTNKDNTVSWLLPHHHKWPFTWLWDLQKFKRWNFSGEQINAWIDSEFSSAWIQAPSPAIAGQLALQKKKPKSLTTFQGAKQGLSRLVANMMLIFPEFGSATQTDVLKVSAVPETNLEANSDTWTFSMCPQCWILTLSH